MWGDHIAFLREWISIQSLSASIWLCPYSYSNPNSWRLENTEGEWWFWCQCDTKIQSAKILWSLSAQETKRFVKGEFKMRKQQGYFICSENRSSQTQRLRCITRGTDSACEHGSFRRSEDVLAKSPQESIWSSSRQLTPWRAGTGRPEMPAALREVGCEGSIFMGTSLACPGWWLSGRLAEKKHVIKKAT